MKKINKKCSSKKSISSSREEISKYPIENSEFETNLPNMDHQNLSTENLPNPSNLQEQQASKTKDSRIPPIGSIISKTYRGQQVEVKVLESGFEYKGKVYKSISRVAMTITKRQISGYVFFGLIK
ncbi:DUF2924 domain-containing protein [Candidatus Avelusimicrobium sp.]